MALIASFEETIWRNLRTREKLKNQTDKDGRPLFSIEVTGDIRIVYSFEQKIVLYSFGGLGGIRKLTVSSPNFLKR